LAKGLNKQKNEKKKGKSLKEKRAEKKRKEEQVINEMGFSEKYSFFCKSS
jgi:hypothetical protein